MKQDIRCAQEIVVVYNISFFNNPHIKEGSKGRWGAVTFSSFSLYSLICQGEVLVTDQGCSLSWPCSYQNSQPHLIITSQLNLDCVKEWSINSWEIKEKLLSSSRWKTLFPTHQSQSMPLGNSSRKSTSGKEKMGPSRGIYLIPCYVPLPCPTFAPACLVDVLWCRLSR